MSQSIEPRTCPRCDYIADSLTAVHEDRAPSEGDVALCINCGLVTRFNAELNQELLTDDEITELPKEVQRELVLAQIYIKVRQYEDKVSKEVTKILTECGDKTNGN